MRHRVTLNATDLNHLFRGGTLTLTVRPGLMPDPQNPGVSLTALAQHVDVVLADIGFDRIHQALCEARLEDSLLGTHRHPEVEDDDG
jgi:hypothetical protein